MSEPVCVRDFEALARGRMEKSAFDYYSGGSGDERTLAENQAAFGRIAFRPRALAKTGHVDTSTTVLGIRLPFPVALAPTAFNKLGHPEGELAAARAAGAVGTLMCCSTIASHTLEEIAAVATGPLWFQLYIYRDRAITLDMVRRAEAAGYRALLLTVDTPRLGRREKDVRNGFVLPQDVTIRNLDQYGKSEATRWQKGSSFTEYVHRMLDPDLSWESVAWLQSVTKLPILLKGVLAGADGTLAVEHGAAGVVVSNHGGRQLDGSMATADALEEVVHGVAGRGTVLVDGGVRRGVDVMAALALGAEAVLVGRPYLWSLAANGEAGVRQCLEFFRSELDLAMALAGCPTVASITRDLVARPAPLARR